MTDPRYAEKRRKIESRFRRMKPVEGSRVITRSPSGLYELETGRYTEGPSSWDYSRGLVRSTKTGELLADIKRNIAGFWHAWVLHANGREYLLCGEDYLGYQVLNLSARQTHTYFPERGHEGLGFCWAGVHPSPETTLLAVKGCFWACSYDIVFFDFRSPDTLPYRELARFSDLCEAEGWRDNDSFVFTRELACRKSDGVPYETLPAEEQRLLDRDSSLIDHRLQRVEIHRQELLPGR